MTSVTQQKSDLRSIIHKRIEEYLNEHPEEVKDVAMGAIRRLSGRMTLQELKMWHQGLYVSSWVSEKGLGDG